MKIPVNTASHSYEVAIGNGILKEAVDYSIKDLFEKADQNYCTNRRKCMGSTAKLF